MDNMSQTASSYAFLEWKLLNLKWNLIEICYQGCDWQQVSMVLVMACCLTNDKPLTLKQLEMYGCILSIVATDPLVLKHQTISAHNAEKTLIDLV